MLVTAAPQTHLQLVVTVLDQWAWLHERHWTSKRRCRHCLCTKQPSLSQRMETLFKISTWSAGSYIEKRCNAMEEVKHSSWRERLKLCNLKSLHFVCIVCTTLLWLMIIAYNILVLQCAHVQSQTHMILCLLCTIFFYECLHKNEQTTVLLLEKIIM